MERPESTREQNGSAADQRAARAPLIEPPPRKESGLTSTAPGSVLQDRRFRLATLNLIEDAEEARRKTAKEAADRGRAEATLRQSEQRLRTVLEAVRIATWEWDPGTDRIAVSHTMHELLGLEPGENYSLAQVLAMVHPEDLPERRAMIEKGVRERTGWHGEFRIVRPGDGEIVWLEERARGTKYPETGAFRMTGVVWDITERKRAEEALVRAEERARLIIENAQDYAIFTTDLQRKVTSWNSGAERILGHTESEILGKKADVIFLDQDRSAGACEEEARTALRDGRAAEERWHQRKDRKRFWGSGVMTVMRGGRGEMTGFLKILRDHTTAKQHEEELAALLKRVKAALAETRIARAEAELANRAKDHFLAALSHELRTPLTPVLMAAESLLNRQDLQPRVREGLEMIRRNIELESHFINDLLDITRITHGQLEIVRKPLDLNEVVRRALEVCGPEIGAKAQRVSVELQAESRTVRGDIARLQQVFWNLLKNASKFTPKKGSIQVLSRNPKAGWIEVTIRDTGRGIEPAALEEVFQAFKQEDSAVTQEFGGLGLGLAIAKAMVVVHDGSICAASEGRGKGASFTVTLPVQADG